jgi:major type 1 subunit fimbrin (pilin)
MRKIQYTLCALALAVSAGANAAYDGKVTFDGELIDDTCTIATDSVDIKVPLPKMQTSLLAAAGDSAGATTFKINVENCPTAITKVAAHFDANANSGWDPATGNLTNAAATDPAKLVQVRLYNTDDNSQIAIGQAGHQFPVDTTTNKASMIYAGGYYATGKAEAGKVSAWVQYVVDYQ